MKSLLTLLGHVVIVVLCLLLAIVLNGHFVATTYSVNGVDVTGLSEAAIVQKLRTGPLLVTMHIGPWVEFPLPGPELGNLIMPASVGILLLLVYGPGFIWPAARSFVVRIGLTAALVVLGLLAL